jgi:hypothetical protein
MLLEEANPTSQEAVPTRWFCLVGPNADQGLEGVTLPYVRQGRRMADDDGGPRAAFPTRAAKSRQRNHSLVRRT